MNKKLTLLGKYSTKVVLIIKTIMRIEYFLLSLNQK